ncbi:hypothetical protein HF086_006514 [Spodoptera exigua]|uniref:Peptidase S1 domain-containing protein n=1 Tax=Spodoptera exigua TaxID=7107 RepID=A0A922MKX0_SPOEX|nr:hypothetical protein HF086_006514 [Spodoptera exigua]
MQKSTSMFGKITILCLLILGTVRISASHENAIRVIHGTDVKEDEFPYVIVLIRKNAFFVSRLCTGSMLTPYWGLSAGHCKETFTPEYSIYVWYGNFSLSPFYTENYIPVVEWNLHPSYRVLNFKNHPDLIVDNDVSLFRIEPELRLASYARLSALDRDSLLGHSVIYIGGGTTKTVGGANENFQRPLKKGEGSITSCDFEIRLKSKHVACIKPKCDLRFQFPWYGDSGGPLIHDEQIVGVCSFVVNASDFFQGAFVPISPYVDWISYVINSKKIEKLKR